MWPFRLAIVTDARGLAHGSTDSHGPNDTPQDAPALSLSPCNYYAHSPAGPICVARLIPLSHVDLHQPIGLMANEQDGALIPTASVLLVIVEVEAANPQFIGDSAVEKYQRKLTIE
jgi:hypothetical protein